MLFSQNTVLVPDYDKGQYIIVEIGDTATRNYYPRHCYGGLAGSKDLSSHLDQQYWTAEEHKRYVIGDYFTYQIPSPGYIQVEANYEMGWYYNTDISPFPNTISFRVGIKKSSDSGTILFDFITPKTASLNKRSDIIPVAKGDIIYWGTRLQTEGIPAEYDITFYPAKPVDAITGD